MTLTNFLTWLANETNTIGGNLDTIVHWIYNHLLLVITLLNGHSFEYVVKYIIAHC